MLPCRVLTRNIGAPRFENAEILLWADYVCFGVGVIRSLHGMTETHTRADVSSLQYFCFVSIYSTDWLASIACLYMTDIEYPGQLDPRRFCFSTFTSLNILPTGWSFYMHQHNSKVLMAFMEYFNHCHLPSRPL
jgi:hypothetical protein